MPLRGNRAVRVRDDLARKPCAICRYAETVSSSFVASLAALVVIAIGARFLLAPLPLRRVAMRVTPTDAILAGVGMVGLVFHCAAMFFRGLVEPLPGLDTAIADIRALGIASVIWYVTPAVLVLLGLRRQHPIALAVLALALAAVGFTMYNGGALQPHLTAIFVFVVILSSIAATLVLPPWRRRPWPTAT